VCSQDVPCIDDPHILYPRWDHAALLTYYDHSFLHLQPILNELYDLSACIDNDENLFDTECFDDVYAKIVNALELCSAIAVSLTTQEKLF